MQRFSGAIDARFARSSLCAPSRSPATIGRIDFAHGRLFSLPTTPAVNGLPAILMAVAATGTVIGVIRASAGLTLRLALPWCVVGSALWLGAALHPFAADSRSDLLWYAGLTAWLGAGMAVLGAKRPGAGAWTSFVLIPMSLMLTWPVVVQLRPGRMLMPLRFDSPAIAGASIVLLMAAGNYLSGRFALSAVALGSGAMYVIASCSAPFSPWADATCRPLCVATCWIFAVAWAWIPMPATAPGVERLWTEFCDRFGLVWQRRLQDRLNQLAIDEQWGVRFDGRRVVIDDADRFAASAVRVEYRLHWLFRRFADADWIADRLGKPVPLEASRFESDIPNAPSQQTDVSSGSGQSSSPSSPSNQEGNSPTTSHTK